MPAGCASSPTSPPTTPATSTSGSPAASGRTGATDLNRDVAPTLRRALNDDSLLVAEHFHDYRPDFRGWHGVMNYAGFSKPVWTWLRGDFELKAFELPVPLPSLGARAVTET